MNVIVDVQGFKTDSNDFIVKEIAMQCGRNVLVLLVKPPFPFYNLTKTERNQVCWIERNRFFFWNEGFIPYTNYKNYIVNYLKNKPIIYVKGTEKVKWIRKILDSDINVDDDQKCFNIVNIEDFGCPNLLSLNDNYKECSEVYNCIYHSKHCALRNVNCLMKWFNENKLRK